VGFSSVAAGELSGVPKRTIQEWRKTGFFVPWLPCEHGGHVHGELYGLSDVLTLRVMRTLLDAGAERKVVAWVGETLPASEDDGEWFQLPVRWFATKDPPAWFMVALVAEILELRPPDGLTHLRDELKFHDEDFVRSKERVDETEHNGVVRGSLDGEDAPWVWLPISHYASELVEKADQWRRQRRIPLKRWPEWM
jgi:hypothetical protein